MSIMIKQLICNDFLKNILIFYRNCNEYLYLNVSMNLKFDILILLKICKY